jgi:hypothetical protein
LVWRFNVPGLVIFDRFGWDLSRLLFFSVMLVLHDLSYRFRVWFFRRLYFKALHIFAAPVVLDTFPQVCAQVLWGLSFRARPLGYQEPIPLKGTAANLRRCSFGQRCFGAI